MRHNPYAARVSSKHQPVGYRFTTRRYEQFQMIYVFCGELLFRDGSARRELGPGGLALLRQNSSFELSCPRVGYDGVCFIAMGDLPDAFVGSAEALSATAESRTLGQLMERQLASPGPEASDVLLGLGRALAWEALRHSRSAPSPPAASRDWAEAVRSTLDATVYSNGSVRDALVGLPMSYRQLSRHFRDAFGLSPKDYQLRLRLAEAQRLLRQTRLPVTDIAMELGFSSSQHLANQFREHIHQTPTEFRAP